MAFFDLLARYGDYYRHALAQLIDDGCIDNVAQLRLLRLTETGYREAIEVAEM